MVTPAVEMQMDLGRPATSRLLARGIPLGLGTDVVASTGADLFGQMCGPTRRRGRSPWAMVRRVWPFLPSGASWSRPRPAEPVPCGWTTRSARTPGKQADLGLLRADRPNLAPVGDPAEAVVLGTETSHVDTVPV